MQTATTHIQRRREALKTVSATIVTLMAFRGDLRLHYFMMDRGWLWLRLHLKGDKDSVAFMESHPLFWQWWRNQWALRDEWLLEDIAHFSKCSLDRRRAFYRLLHNPLNLNDPKNEWGARMYESYALLIDKINRGL